MAGGMVEGAAVGVGFQEVVKPITGLLWKGVKFESTRRKLESTVERVTPALQKMESLDEKLNRPKEESGKPIEEVQNAQELLNRYSNVRWWKFFCFPCYQDELQAMYERVETSLAVVLQPEMARDLKEVVWRIRDIQGGKQFKGLCKPPEIRDMNMIVGLQSPLNKLKKQVLETGSSVLVLTGLAGSGKTTLATLLCRDEEVRGKFGEDNILFVTVTKTPILKNIVHSIFKHYGKVPELDLGVELMVRQLQNLLKEIGQSPLMLVLDDVWCGSESLIEDFRVQHLSHYKILVTSRFKFRRFGTPCHLKPLCLEDTVSLLRHFALPHDGTMSHIPHEDLVQQVATGCHGSPLVLKLIGTSLRGQPITLWQKKEKILSQHGSIVASDTDLLEILQKWLDDALQDEQIIKECFMDLALFPEDQRIPVAALIDMWIELHKLDDGGIDAINKVHELTDRHLADLLVTREVESDIDNYYNNHFLVQHDLVRDIAIHQHSREPYEQRKRLMIDLTGDGPPEWCIGQNPQGILSRMLSFLPIWWTEQKQKQVAARILSISTDENFTLNLCNLQPDEAEVLILNIRSSKFTLPAFTNNMRNLKVLIVTNYGFHPSELNKFELRECSDLKRIRLEKVSVPCLCEFKSLQKLSFHMCNTRQTFESSSIQISDALPKLVEMNIDYSNDLVELPSGICEITTLKKLSITNCHNLSALPQEIGKLKNLEVLRLSSCSDLLKIPESVGSLQNLRFLDISGCISLDQLPEGIGNLNSLKKLYMWGCTRLSEVPYSVMNFKDLNHVIYVICDEEVAALWENFTKLSNVKIETSKADVSLKWLGVM